jgi:hypothetical protein
MNKAELSILDNTIENAIRLERFTTGERKKVLAILDGLQKELRVKLMGDLTDFSKARVNKLLSESTVIIEAAYKEIAPFVPVKGPWNFTHEDIAKILTERDTHPATKKQEIAEAKKLLTTGVPRIDSNLLHPEEAAKAWAKVSKEFPDVAGSIRGIGEAGGKLGNLSDSLAGFELRIGSGYARSYAKGGDLEKYYETVIRHELLHARAFKLGLEKYGTETPAVLHDVIDRLARGEAISTETLKAYRGLESMAAQSTNLLGLARHEATATSQAIATIGLEAAIPTEAVLRALVNGSIIEGSPAAAWWAKQSDDLAFKFASQVRQGIAQNETLMDIIRRVAGSPRLGIPGIIEVSRRNAGALVHTSIMQVANDARMAVYQANQDIMKGYRYLSTLDGNICPRCIARSGSTWDLEYRPTGGTKLEYVPTPIHFKCRCLILPILKSYKELGADIPEPPSGTRASDEGQVRADITMTEWLKSKPKAYVDDLLGPGRSDLFLNGKISLSDLVSQNGRPLTLEQLRAK